VQSEKQTMNAPKIPMQVVATTALGGNVRVVAMFNKFEMADRWTSCFPELTEKLKVSVFLSVNRVQNQPNQYKRVERQF
jgi:hypothetical protein